MENQGAYEIMTTLVDGSIGKENINTGVIYRVTNMTDGKIYIGKAYSYVKNGCQPLIRHGAANRWYKHCKSASQNNVVDDCPSFYEAIRKDGQEKFKVDVLKITSLKHLKEYEGKAIKQYRSYDPNIGYNFFVGDNKPIDGANRKIYEMMKANSNRNRAIGGGLRQGDESKDLPPNIYIVYRKAPNGEKIGVGYKVQLRDNSGKLHMKAYTKDKETMEQKLQNAKDYLLQIKKETNIDQIAQEIKIQQIAKIIEAEERKTIQKEDKKYQKYVDMFMGIKDIDKFKLLKLIEMEMVSQIINDNYFESDDGQSATKRL